jgi:hypothetical protein
MFSALHGVISVRIEPIIQSMVIEYQSEQINRGLVLGYVSLFFKQTHFDPLDDIMVNIRPSVRKDLYRSFLSGLFIFIAYTRRTMKSQPDPLDYAAVISTAFTVLSHGKNKFRHPDVITGIVSMLSLGAHNILHVTLVTWAVNVLEILHDLRRNQNKL